MSYPPYSCTAGPHEERAEEIIQTTSGALSIIGSSYIVFDVVRKLCGRNTRAGKTDSYQRIMLGLSFYDILHSFFNSFMGTWMTPVETGWLMSAGNQATCNVQGFFTAFGFFGSFGYQIALSFNILLLIALGWSQEKFARKLEKPIHISTLTIAVAYATIPLPLESYNGDCGECLWAPLYDESGNLVRGRPQLQSLYWKLFWAYLWIMIIFCTIAMIGVYFIVRRQENKMKKYKVKGSEEDSHRESKRIRKILLLYTVALYLCWGIPFTVIFASIELGAWPSKIPFGVRALLEMLIPLSGLFNMLVYFLPKCLKHQQMNPGTRLIMSYASVLGPSTRFSLRTLRLGEAVVPTGEATGDETADSGMNFATFNEKCEHTEDVNNTSFANMNVSMNGGEEGRNKLPSSEESKESIA